MREAVQVGISDVDAVVKTLMIDEGVKQSNQYDVKLCWV